jgi:hypothetical protein
MDQNLCALLTDDNAARQFLSAVAEWADFRHDARNMCTNVVVDAGKQPKNTLPGDARFSCPPMPTEKKVLNQTALLGDPNKVFLMVIAVLFSSADIRAIVSKFTPRTVAADYFGTFHDRIEAAKIGTPETGILPEAVIVAHERIKLFSICATRGVKIHTRRDEASHLPIPP